MSYYRIQDYDPHTLLEGAQTSLSYRTDTERSGKSVCASIEDLAAYMAQVGIPIDWNRALLVELEGTWSDEEDEDAHLGVYLMHPTRIVSVTPLDDTNFYDLVDTYLANH